ncbi:MAG TPA: hypothetical protein VFQ21_07550 [Gemmatimonadota bacterium]|nr:hypothetical protein [Gemmatimonadota bacterium]
MPAFLRQRVTLEEARDLLRRRLDEREANFLDLAERGIYGYPASPYLPLLRAAGCELGDLRSLVRTRGLEGALFSLRDAGVYVTFEEFKGRSPIERNGVVVDTRHGTFHNPLSERFFTSRSSGSTGAPVEGAHDLAHILAGVPSRLISCDAHGVLGAPLGLWRCAPPVGAGTRHVLQSIVMGNVARRWFAPIGSDEVPSDFGTRLTTDVVLRECRLFGHAVPFPEPVPFERAAVVARWAAETASGHGRCLVRTGLSMAMRVAAAAEDAGFGLEGVTFMAGGEPPTPAKVGRIRATGAKYVPHYGGSDMGHVGAGCANPLNESDVHFMEDSLAVLQVPHTIPGFHADIDAFCFTTLLRSAGRLLLNVELDDFGTMERRSCGCPFDDLGFGIHISGVRSYRKLTGEGINLLDGEMVRILEEVLPSRYGGDPHDYQLHEREDPDGFTRLVLVVDPRIDLPAEADVIDVLLAALSTGDLYADSAREHWQQGRSFRIERREPEWLARGKFPSLIVHRV